MADTARVHDNKCLPFTVKQCVHFEASTMEAMGKEPLLRKCAVGATGIGLGYPLSLAFGGTGGGSDNFLSLAFGGKFSH